VIFALSSNVPEIELVPELPNIVPIVRFGLFTILEFGLCYVIGFIIFITYRTAVSHNKYLPMLLLSIFAACISGWTTLFNIDVIGLHSPIYSASTTNGPTFLLWVGIAYSTFIFGLTMAHFNGTMKLPDKSSSEKTGNALFTAGAFHFASLLILATPYLDGLNRAESLASS